MSAQRLLVALIILIVCCATSAKLGWNYRDGEVVQQVLEAVKEQQEKFDAAQLRADGLELQLSALRTARLTNDRIITKEVARYVEVTPADQRCTLPGTWRVRHDAAATGIPTDAGAGSLAFGADAAVEDAAAIETVADNYAIARECADKLEGWKRRYRTVELGEQEPPK